MLSVILYSAIIRAHTNQKVSEDNVVDSKVQTLKHDGRCQNFDQRANAKQIQYKI